MSSILLILFTFRMELSSILRKTKWVVITTVISTLKCDLVPIEPAESSEKCVKTSNYRTAPT